MTDIDLSGFSIQPDVFTATEATEFLAMLNALPIAQTRAGARHLLRFSKVRAIAEEPRLLTLASICLKRDAIAFRATLFAKSLNANWLVVWHQDTALPMKHHIDSPEWGPWSLKQGTLYAHAPAWALEKVVALRIHLDDSTSENGPLRVLPQTHRQGILTDDAMHAAARSSAAVECLGKAGAVLSMRPLLVHASSKSVNSTPRRVLHIEYAESALLAAGAELAVA